VQGYWGRDATNTSKRLDAIHTSKHKRGRTGDETPLTGDETPLTTSRERRSRVTQQPPRCRLACHGTLPVRSSLLQQTQHARLHIPNMRARHQPHTTPSKYAKNWVRVPMPCTRWACPLSGGRANALYATLATLAPLAPLWPTVSAPCSLSTL